MLTRLGQILKWRKNRVTFAFIGRVPRIKKYFLTGFLNI